MNTELSSATYRKAADIQEKIEELRKQLQQLLGESAQAEAPAQQEAPKAARRGKRKSAKEPAVSFRKSKARGGKRSGNGVTTNQAILQVLEEGQQDIPTIVSRVNEIKGKASRGAIVQALATLKKEGKISNPARGQYAKE